MMMARVLSWANQRGRKHGKRMAKVKGPSIDKEHSLNYTTTSTIIPSSSAQKASPQSESAFIRET
jgi:hypothetical protein